MITVLAIREPEYNPQTYYHISRNNMPLVKVREDNNEKRILEMTNEAAKETRRRLSINFS